MDLNQYQYLLWDFDGVILNSDSIRTDGFREVLKHHNQEQVEKLVAFHKANGGLSRYVKFRYFYKNILGKGISEEQILELAAQFSETMLKLLVNPSLIIKDTENFLIHKSQTTPMYIVSGSDQTELRQICAQLGLAKYFKGIFGSPTAKIKLVENLISQGDIEAGKTCLIGDAGNDFDAASSNNIDFYGFNNPDLRGRGKGYIKSFMPLQIEK